MSAVDNLGPQFMSMGDLKGLRSGDRPGTKLTVGQTLTSKRRDILEDPYYNSVRRSMQENGQTAPLGVVGGTLYEGHHRVAIAADMGWPGMNVVSARHDQVTTDPVFDRFHS